MPGRPLRVLAFTSYPVEAAVTRFRLVQLIPDLAAAGIEVSVRPFLDAATWRTFYDRRALPRTVAGLAQGLARRVLDLVRARQVDVILVLREAMVLGPPVVEWLAPLIGRCPLVLDLDDPTWVGYDSPSYGRVARLLKWPGKALTLIDRSDFVTCGSRYLAQFVQSRGGASIVVPAVVDTDLFRPTGSEATPGMPTVGWIGSHSTFPYLEAIVPALAEAARTHPYRMYVVGSGTRRLAVPGVEVEHRAWDLAREPADFASLDVGLYPLPDNDPWAQGKSALKSVQYLASGVPFVASPVGAVCDIGVAGTTHALAATAEQWTRGLVGLLGDRQARARMGEEGRRYALAHHTTAIGAALLAGVLHQVRP